MRDVPALKMGWRDCLFAHWPVEPSRVRSVVPDELDVDTREGTAWVSALASVVESARPWFLPRIGGVGFPQVNLRTYVRHDTAPGVYFLSLDVPTAIGVRLARAVYGLPYYRADIDFERDGETNRVEVRRGESGEERPPARFTADYRPVGAPARAEPGSLQEFLAERYHTFVVRDESVWCARIEHAPWRLCPVEATVHADSLFEAAGLPAPADDPAVRYTPGTEMTVRTPFRA